VFVFRLLERQHVEKREEFISPNLPSARRIVNSWVREHFESIVHGNVLLCYKAVVPAIVKEKKIVAVDRQDDVHKDMVALVYNHLADGRAATRALFSNDFRFLLVHETLLCAFLFCSWTRTSRLLLTLPAPNSSNTRCSTSFRLKGRWCLPPLRRRRLRELRQYSGRYR